LKYFSFLTAKQERDNEKNYIKKIARFEREKEIYLIFGIILLLYFFSGVICLFFLILFLLLKQLKRGDRVTGAEILRDLGEELP